MKSQVLLLVRLPGVKGLGRKIMDERSNTSRLLHACGPKMITSYSKPIDYLARRQVLCVLPFMCEQL